MYVAHVGGSVHRKRAVRGKVSTYGAVYIGRAVGYVTHVGSVHLKTAVRGLFDWHSLQAFLHACVAFKNKKAARTLLRAGWSNFRCPAKDEPNSVLQIIPTTIDTREVTLTQRRL